MTALALGSFALLSSAAAEQEQDGARFRSPNSHEIAEAQARSSEGAAPTWQFDDSFTRQQYETMRDRAYAYCLREKLGDPECTEEQDRSIFFYARSFLLVPLFRSEANPQFSFARAHKLNPEAFDTIHRQCRAIYEDHGSHDARMLGPCMAAGLGADYFAIADVR